MTLGTARIIQGDATHLPLDDSSVDLVITSPPYFGLRSYQDACPDCADTARAGTRGYMQRYCPQCARVFDSGRNKCHVCDVTTLRTEATKAANATNDCTTCGGTGRGHYAGQLGDEPTPAEYVNNLITATREMARVLKPTGSIWVNLGDRYSDGMPLDAVLTVADAGWLAGLIDADGTITVRHTQQPSMRAPTFEGIISVEQMDREAVERCHAITGRGKVHQVNGSRGRTMYRWTVSTQQARWVAERIWPFLRIKARQAKAIVELGRHREECQARGRYAQIKPEWVQYRRTICDAVRAWNQRDNHPWEPPALPVLELPLRPRFIPAKSLTGIPWRYALRCIDDLGLILRAEIIWSKPNGLPESVTDRVRRSHEVWFHFVKQPRYYSAIDHIREPHTTDISGWKSGSPGSDNRGRNVQSTAGVTSALGQNVLGKLPGSVWEIPTQPLTIPDHLGVDHYAAFPIEWPRRIIQAWSPPGICTACRQGRRPVTQSAATGKASTAARGGGNSREAGMPDFTHINRSEWREGVTYTITGYACDCPTPTAPTTPSVILDPFGGTGTTALAAKAQGRHGITLDMSADYNRIARWRCNDPAQLASAMQVDKPPTQHDGQLDLLDGILG